MKHDGVKPKDFPAKKNNSQPLVAGKTKQTGAGAGEYEHHYISLAHDSNMVAGKEKMRRCSIAKITEARGVIVDGRKVEELLKTRINAQWNWDARILKDGRYIIECPSALIARQIEKAGKMESPKFTLDFTPWTADLYGPAKAEGALRWTLVKNLPMCYWDLDSIAKMLKPVGDLVLIGERAVHATEDFRALIRIRRPRRLPSALHCSVSTLQHTYFVELEKSQPELPWPPYRQTERDEEAEIESKKQQAPAKKVQQFPETPRPNRVDKGNAPMERSVPPPANRSTGKHRGIIIREWQESEDGRCHETDRPCTEKKIRIARRPAPAPATDGATERMKEKTRHGGDTADAGPEKMGPDRAASAAQPGSDGSEVNSQLPEDKAKSDFEETVQALTATWQYPVTQTMGMDSREIPNKLDSLIRSSPLLLQAEKSIKPMESGGPHQIYNNTHDHPTISHLNNNSEPCGPIEKETHPVLVNDSITMAHVPSLPALVDQPNLIGSMAPHSVPQEESDSAHLDKDMASGPMNAFGPKENNVMYLAMNETSLTTYPYTMTPIQPIHNIIKSLVRKIGIDLLEKASLKLIANTWNLISDEAWLQLTNGMAFTNTPTELHQTVVNPRITEMEAPGNTKGSQLTEATTTRTRGRPKKINPPKDHTVDTHPNNQIKKKRLTPGNASERNTRNWRKISSTYSPYQSHFQIGQRKKL
ncbi:hypothetical protein J5N97_019577 [Dioscorea zingiberensis]|uniref:DUF4283 domain-containing protein n=1 Tax=Dioscorea zingiberensis TaxID=325984 RepID=A0A9D5CFA7_9LILI|nr:hypothetical protein J5N97_019577 [Dioscorea zingiberensis]